MRQIIIDLFSGPAVALITFLLGLLIGNWQAIGRDKRKELNEIIGPLRVHLFRERQSGSPMQSPGIAERDRLDSYDIGIWRRDRVRKALAAYDKAKQDERRVSESGKVSYKNPDVVKNNIDHLLSLLKHR